MTTVSVSELKAHLSRYLREVRRGGEVQVLDRGIPVAVLRPVSRDEEGTDNRRERLIRAGVIRPGTKPCNPLASAPLKTGASLLESLDREYPVLQRSQPSPRRNARTIPIQLSNVAAAGDLAVPGRGRSR